MAKLTKQDVAHVASLAKLDLTTSEVEKFTEQLSGVVDFISKLNKVDVKGIEPTSQTTGLENVYRQDRVISDKSLSQEEALSGTEKTHNGYFKVEAILTERSDK